MIETIIALVNSSGFGVVLGAGISILTTYLANRYATKDKREQKFLEVSYDLQIRQLNLLIDLQKAFDSFGRLNVLCHMSLIKDGLVSENGRRICSPELDEQRRLARVELSQISSQIQSDSIREKVREATCLEAWSDNLEDIRSCLDDILEALYFTTEAIGAEIRNTQGSLSKIFDCQKP